MYTKSKFFKIVSQTIICLSTLFLALLSSTSTEGKIFKIEDIEISEKFDVNFNKEKAINNAFVIAFKELTSSVITTKDEKNNTFVRRKLNPDYNPDIAYLSRESRPEWATIGMMGKLVVRRGQPIGANWILMKSNVGTDPNDSNIILDKYLVR